MVAQAAEEDVRPVRPEWGELEDLVLGARRRGFSEAQVDYLASVVGVTWAKAFRRGEAAGKEEDVVVVGTAAAPEWVLGADGVVRSSAGVELRTDEEIDAAFGTHTLMSSSMKWLRKNPSPPPVVVALPGWRCVPCGVFNGEAKERLDECRACGAERPT